MNSKFAEAIAKLDAAKAHYNPRLHERYLKIRQNDAWMPAKQALTLARYELSPEPDFEWDKPFEVDGLEVTATLDYDNYPDLSYLGEFFDSWNDGAVENPDWYYDKSRTLRWFHPENTEREHYEGLRAMKYGKAAAREHAHKYVMEDLKRARENVSYVVLVRVAKNGIELGSAALGGIDDDGRYAKETAMELVPEAVEQAKAAIRSLTQRTAVR